jgi:4'-phosphopantetheinyl transferase
LRLALAAHGGRAFGDVELTVVDERPHAPGMPDLRLSLSHSGMSVACALCEPCACGLDLQRKVDKPMLEIAETCYTPTEHEQLANLGARDRENSFYDWWTLKEAWAKASGTDLRHALSRVRVARPGEAPTPDWFAWSFEPEPGMAGALVVSAMGDRTVEPTIALWRGDSFVTADFACRPVALAIKDA